MPSFEFCVPEDFSCGRLDKIAAEAIPEMNRSKLKSGLRAVLVNGRPAKLSMKVRAGDRIGIEWEDCVPVGIEPEDIPLDVVYEDSDVTVVNKRSGMVTHPALGNWSGTLVNALLFRWGRGAVDLRGDSPESEKRAEVRPGIVHRLDRDTSGIIVTARNRRAEEWLHDQFKDHRLLKKEYVAICSGRPKTLSGKIENYIERNPADRKSFRVSPKGQGKFACTLYECVGIYERGSEAYSLFRLRIKTGRTHQIRVHLKSIGCPILGDPIYNPGQKGEFRDSLLMLHSILLKIRLPGMAEFSEFRAPIPVRFRKVMAVLHKHFRRSFP